MDVVGPHGFPTETPKRGPSPDTLALKPKLDTQTSSAMVGVPGKYKGCETCRLRRVKCDNQRPFCRKCTDNGRDCAGYERETVFIIGTVEDQGRCSSHPPRVVKSRKGKSPSPKRGKPSSPKRGEKGGFEVVPETPLKPAWDDLVAVSCRRENHHLQVASLHTQSRDVARVGGDDNADEVDAESVFVSLPPYKPPSAQSELGGDGFQLASQCLVGLATPDDGQGTATTDSICLFLYEQNTTAYFGGQPGWKDASVQNNTVRGLGPEHFRLFPAHHFFARVYRPNAIMTALQNRTPTFLALPQWLSTPFANHPKSPFDRLLDILAALASLLSRCDQALAQPHTLTRRLTSQELLNFCLDLELDLGRWYSSLSQHLSPGSHQHQHQYQTPLFWHTYPHSHQPSRSPSPFSTTPPPQPTNHYHHHHNHHNQHPFPRPALTFLNPHIALSLTYYWTALTLLYLTIWRLYFAAVIDPIIVAEDSTTTTATTTGLDQHQHHQQQQQQGLEIATGINDMDLSGVGLGLGLNMGVGMGMGLGIPVASLPVPARLQGLDVMRYSLGRVREVAGDVCRGVEFLLGGDGDDNCGGGDGGGGGMVQPDLLWGVLGVVGGFYGGLVGDEDGRLEELWCERLRERLVARGREVREVVVGRRWVDLAAF